MRITKEHAIFAAASLPPRDRQVAQQLLGVKNAYATLLARAVFMAPGIVAQEKMWK